MVSTIMSKNSSNHQLEPSRILNSRNSWRSQNPLTILEHRLIYPKLFGLETKPVETRITPTLNQRSLTDYYKERKNPKSPSFRKTKIPFVKKSSFLFKETLCSKSHSRKTSIPSLVSIAEVEPTSKNFLESKILRYLNSNHLSSDKRRRIFFKIHIGNFLTPKRVFLQVLDKIC